LAYYCYSCGANECSYGILIGNNWLCPECITYNRTKILLVISKKRPFMKYPDFDICPKCKKLQSSYRDEKGSHCKCGHCAPWVIGIRPMPLGVRKEKQ